MATLMAETTRARGNFVASWKLFCQIFETTEGFWLNANIDPIINS